MDAKIMRFRSYEELAEYERRQAISTETVPGFEGLNPFPGTLKQIKSDGLDVSDPTKVLHLSKQSDAMTFDTILLENDGHLHSGTEEFIGTLSKRYEKYNPKIDESYLRNRAAIDFAMHLCQPSIKHIVSISAFENIVAPPLGKIQEISEEPENQLSFYIPLAHQVANFREQYGFEPITYHLVYLGDDFLDALTHGYFGPDAQRALEFFHHQTPDQFRIKIYSKDGAQIKFEYDLGERINVE
jgi:hypothetical protein